MSNSRSTFRLSTWAAAALVVGLAFVALVQAGPLTERADAAACEQVDVRGEGTATHIRTRNVSCRPARAKLRRWMETRFPRNQLGWYCAMSRPRKLCSGGNGMGAPYFTFRLS
jgi:hypothetical protein